METVKVMVDYDGEVKLNGYAEKAPLEVTWFRGNDLVIESECEKIVFNTTTQAENDKSTYFVRLGAPTKELKIIENVDLKIAESGTLKYLIINNRYAHKLGEIDLKKLF